MKTLKSTSHALTRVVLTVLLVLTTAHAQNVGNRPADAWRSFTWGGGTFWALKAAEDAMRAAGLTVAVRQSPTDLETRGESEHASVVVSCVSLGNRSHIFLLATSTDSFTANFFRDSIGNRIQNTRPPQAIDGQQ